MRVKCFGINNGQESARSLKFVHEISKKVSNLIEEVNTIYLANSFNLKLDSKNDHYIGTYLFNIIMALISPIRIEVQ